MRREDISFSALGSIYKGEHPAYLDEALKSLYNQSLPAREVVLVHDGPLASKFDSCLNKWRKILPLKEIPLEKQGGLAHALNAGLKECSHEWVARFDTDDINKPERFEVQFKHLKQHPEISVLSSDIGEFDKIPGDLDSIRKTAYSHK